MHRHPSAQPWRATIERLRLFREHCHNAFGGGELIHAKAGTYVVIPPGVLHDIANASDKSAGMIMTVSPWVTSNFSKS
jgi:oxalate decarboxylase/phosphoglucose isomerase-like protein (cupin superfamily)